MAKVTVIGSGFSGLASACYAAKSGLDVTEKMKSIKYYMSDGKSTFNTAKSSIEITTFSQVILEATTQLLFSISLSQHSILTGYPDNSKSVIFSQSLTFLKSTNT